MCTMKQKRFRRGNTRQQDILEAAVKNKARKESPSYSGFDQQDYKVKTYCLKHTGI